MTSLLKVTLAALCAIATSAFGQSVPLTQDTYITPGNATNFGTAATMNVGGPGSSQALVQFDLSTLPSSRCL
jgi:hypothetical protein